MKTFSLLSVVVFCAAIAGCPTPHVPPAGVDCGAACENLQSLSCPEGGPTPAGVPCSTWLCETPKAPERTACIAHAASCEAARACQ